MTDGVANGVVDGVVDGVANGVVDGVVDAAQWGDGDESMLLFRVRAERRESRHGAHKRLRTLPARALQLQLLAAGLQDRT